MSDTDPGIESPVPLTQSHETAWFDSGEPALDDWLRRRAWNNLKLGASRTYVICPGGPRRVIGYVALSMGQIVALETTGAMRRNRPPQIPSVILGRLAIGRAWQGRDLGAALLAEADTRAARAARAVAARLILVHAIFPAAEAFYRHHGFTRLRTDSPTLALDLTKLPPAAPEPAQ